MATLNSMLIPAVKNSCGLYVAIVKNEDEKTIWTSALAHQYKAKATAEAEEAVSLIAYQRRHQLRLF